MENHYVKSWDLPQYKVRRKKQEWWMMLFKQLKQQKVTKRFR